MTSKAARISVAQERAFWIVAALLCLTALSYCMLVRATIVAAVAQQTMESQVSTVGVNLASLGEEYLTQTNALTIQKAQSLGLTPVTNVTYVTRSSGNALSYNDR